MSSRAVSTVRAFACLVLALVLGPACAASDWGARADGGVWVPEADAARPDAGAAADAAGVDGATVSADAAGTAPDGWSPGLDSREASCFDFTDDDDDGLRDCSDIGCEVTAICCAAGSTDASCCRGGIAADVVASGCTAGDPMGCGDVAQRIGDASIVADVETEACGLGPVTALWAGGDETTDGGVLVGAAVDPMVSRVIVRATLGARPGPEVDAIGVGLTAQTNVGGRVVPLAAIVLSAGDAELRVIVGDTVVGVMRLADVPGVTCASEVPVVLELSPDGTFVARAGAATLAEGTFPPARSARVVAFGRGDAPGALGPAAWLSSLEVERSVCSVTAPGRDVAPTLGTGWTLSPRSIGRLTVLPSRGLAAVLVDGRVYGGTVDAATGAVSIPDPGVANAILRPEGAYAGGVSDPELVVDAGTLYLLFAGRATPTSPSAIYALRFGPAGLGDALPPAQPVLDAATINSLSAGEFAAPEVRSVDSPAYFVRAARNVLLVRVETVDGDTELRFLDRLGGLETSGTADGATPGNVTRADEPSTTRWRLHANRAGAPAAFDRDEIAAASAIDLGDGVVRVLYSGRNGTHWGIGMLLSEDLVHFDFGNTGLPVLTHDGAGFDALSVSAPEAMAIPGAGGVTELRIFYVGSDGLRSRVGLASQSIAVVTP